MARPVEVWTYDYTTLSKLTGMSRNALQQHRTRGTLDPADLESVVLFCARNGSLALRAKIVGALLGDQPPKPKKRVAKPRR